MRLGCFSQQYTRGSGPAARPTAAEAALLPMRATWRNQRMTPPEVLKSAM